MRRVIKFFWILLLIVGEAKGQQIQKEKDYYLTPQSDTVFMTTYTVSNDSNNELILWFDLGEKHNPKKSNEYFYKVKGDFSIMDIMNDESVSNKRFDIINLSFLKEIRKKGKFVISVLYKSRGDWENNSFDNKIVLIKENDLQTSIKSAISRNRSFLYNSGFIIIPLDSLQHADELDESNVHLN